MFKNNIIGKVFMGILLGAAILTAFLGAATLLAVKAEGGYAMLEGYSMMAVFFGSLLAIPLGIGFKMTVED